MATQHTVVTADGCAHLEAEGLIVHGRGQERAEATQRRAERLEFRQSRPHPPAQLAVLAVVQEAVVQQEDRSPVLLVADDAAQTLQSEGARHKETWRTKSKTLTWLTARLADWLYQFCPVKVCPAAFTSGAAEVGYRAGSVFTGGAGGMCP